MLWLAVFLSTVCISTESACHNKQGGRALMCRKRTREISVITVDIVKNEDRREDYCVFSGVYYAMRPMAELSFRYPQPAQWTGAIVFSLPRSCYSFFDWKEGGVDCLTMDIAGPLHTCNRLPLLVLIVGDNFSQFRGRRQLRGLVRQLVLKCDCVVVIVHYRLGSYGYAFLDHLDKNWIGNQSLADQRSAIEWIYKSASIFGADSSKITVVGVGAGADALALNLVTHPSLAHNVARLILQSGNALNPTILRRSRDIRRWSRAYFNTTADLNLDNFTKVETMTVRNVIHTISTANSDVPPLIYFGFGPHGNKQISYDYAVRALKGKNITVMIGHNLNDGWTTLRPYFSFLPNSRTMIARKPLREAVYFFFSDYISDENIERILQHHSITSLSKARRSNEEILTYIATKFVYSSPSRHFANALADAGIPVYKYEFRGISEYHYTRDQPYKHNVVGDELMFAFDNISRETFPGQERLAKEMFYYWKNFIQIGNPDPRHVNKTWPLYNTHRKTITFVENAPQNALESETEEDRFWMNILEKSINDRVAADEKYMAQQRKKFEVSILMRYLSSANFERIICEEIYVLLLSGSLGGLLYIAFVRTALWAKGFRAITFKKQRRLEECIYCNMSHRVPANYYSLSANSSESFF